MLLSIDWQMYSTMYVFVQIHKIQLKWWNFSGTFITLFACTVLMSMPWGLVLQFRACVPVIFSAEFNGIE